MLALGLGLLIAQFSGLRQAPPPWDFSDGANGEMGLASRGLFAVELMSLEYHLVVWKVHYHALPAIEKLRNGATLLRAAAVQLRLPASAAAGKQAAETAVNDYLAPLVSSATFTTQVQGGRPLKEAAHWAGRQRNPTSGNPNPQPYHTECSGRAEPDGGAVPLLQGELTDAANPASGAAAAVAGVIECVAKQVPDETAALPPPSHPLPRSGRPSLTRTR